MIVADKINVLLWQMRVLHGVGVQYNCALLPDEMEKVKEKVDEKDLHLYINECFAKIAEKSDILEIIALDDNNDPIRSTIRDRQVNLDYTGLFGSLLMKARRAVRLMDANDELVEIRVRTRKHETFIIPDENVTFITVQSSVDRI